MATSSAAALTDPVPNGEGAALRRKRLTFHERALVVSLRKLDHTHEDIAAQLGISTKSVSRVLQCYGTDLKQTTQELMQTGILESLDDWQRARKVAAKKGDHRPAKDWAIAAGAIDDTNNTTLNVGFQVVVAPSPGTPNYPTLDVTPTQALTTTDTQRQSSAEPVQKRLRR